MNIAEKLKDAPKGTKLYSPIFGEVEFDEINSLFIDVKYGEFTARFYKDGKYTGNGECMLFPSKENKDWNDVSIPKFKVGDTIMRNNLGAHVITKVTLDKYYLDNSDSLYISIKEQVLWNKVIPKFNIVTLKPFDKVLVRDDINDTWKADFYSHYEEKAAYNFRCVGTQYIQCIPYNDETKHLLGTDKECPEYYKTW